MDYILQGENIKAIHHVGKIHIQFTYVFGKYKMYLYELSKQVKKRA